jgi:hypothetical protein
MSGGKGALAKSRNITIAATIPRNINITAYTRSLFLNDFTVTRTP